ncbi:hypothetical protein Cgig2_018632 [Carnegiea gigantea]|uniref:Uncharacterized protein n=1 Tax=Carnegiea gigantea TaxID=171969 RepID=A0A9Q1KDX2_9CARY|nr:hypothetical protein Cgig2_018632 [Carnegiea gigantea]
MYGTSGFNPSWLPLIKAIIYSYNLVYGVYLRCDIFPSPSDVLGSGCVQQQDIGKIERIQLQERSMNDFGSLKLEPGIAIGTTMHGIAMLHGFSLQGHAKFVAEAGLRHLSGFGTVSGLAAADGSLGSRISLSFIVHLLVVPPWPSLSVWYIFLALELSVAWLLLMVLWGGEFSLLRCPFTSFAPMAFSVCLVPDGCLPLQTGCGVWA